MLKVSKGCKGLLGLKTKIHLGKWNVRTMYETSKTTEVPSEIKKYHFDILWTSESQLAPDANFFCPPLWSLCLFTWSCHYNLQKQAIPKPWVGIGLWNSTQLNFKYCKLICSAMLQKMRLRRRTKRSGTKKSKWQSLSYLMQHAADNCRHDYQVGTNNFNYVRAMGTLGHASRMVTALLIFVSITTW